MVIVRTAKCPKCKQVLYSRAIHDFRYCSCEEIFIDGGFDYTKIGGTDLATIETGIAEIDATKEELYNDWNYGYDKYGILSEAEEIEEIEEVEIKETKETF